MDPFEQGNTEFALELYHQLGTGKGNLFFSPHSISTALGMTYAGARGETEVQMARALHFFVGQEQLHAAFAALQAQLDSLAGQAQIQLTVANSLWPQRGYPFLDEFLAMIRRSYGVEVTPIDYTDGAVARQLINTWVEAKTEGKIKNLLLPPVPVPLTRLILVNAIYFKGRWASQFDPSLTKNAPFWFTPAEQVQVPMMTQMKLLQYGESDGLQILELPYHGAELSLTVLLPRARDGLTELERSLTLENLGRWTSHLRPAEVLVFLPRFELTGKYQLDDQLIRMGMADAFSAEADFSGMDGREKWLYIGAILHQACVEVNEEGTVAAAATAVITLEKSIGAPVPPTFRADHPFVFFIREHVMGSILFLGRIVNPGNADVCGD